MQNKPRARADGRPQYYDVAPGDRIQCYHCLLKGLHSQYTRGEGFLADWANSPAGDTNVYTVCRAHIEDNAVIFDPATNTCRTKDGSSTWRETEKGIEDMSFADKIRGNK